MVPAKFELRSGESWRNPFATYKALRDQDPVHHVEKGDYYVLTRFEDVWSRRRRFGDLLLRPRADRQVW